MQRMMMKGDYVFERKLSRLTIPTSYFSFLVGYWLLKFSYFCLQTVTMLLAPCLTHPPPSLCIMMAGTLLIRKEERVPDLQCIA